MKPYLLKWKSGIALFVLLTGVVQLSEAQQQFALSAQESVDFAMKNAVQVKNALLGIQRQRQVNREITGAAYPQINGSLNYTNYIDIPTSLVPGEFFGQPAGSFIPVQFGVKHNLNYGVDLNQLLFDGQVFVGLQARKTANDFAEATADVTKVQILSNVLKIYYQLLAGRQQIASIDANISRIQKLLDDTKQIYKNGFAEKLDVDKAEVTLTNLRTEKIRVQNQYEVGVQGLKLLIGMKVQDQLVLTDTLPEKQLTADVLDQPYSYTDRAEFKQVELQEKLNEFNIRRYKLTYIPTLSVSANYNRNAQRNEFNFLKGDQPWFKTTYVAVKLNVPIFDGFARAARVKQAQIDLQATQNNRENLKLMIDNEVDQARINLRSALASMEYQKKNMDLAEKVYNQTKLKYEQGLGSNLEVTNSQAELTTAQNNYYSALYDAIVARIDFQRATGKVKIPD